MIQITGFKKHGGPLTKRISLGADGTLCSDGSQCVMANGTAQRVRLPDLHSFGRLLDRMTPEMAIGLGALRHDLPDKVAIVTKAWLQLNGSHAMHLIARTNEHIMYRPGQLALVLIDVDTKGMPTAVKERIDVAGGFWPALVSVVPELEAAGRVLRKSTSAGLHNIDTNERLPGSNGEHVFVLVADGTDAERFLRAMHDRCWLHGFGWLMVGAGGQLLDRSIVDRMVGAPERLVFEGPPVLELPLMQDPDSRRPVVTSGAPLDALAACPPLRIVEQARLKELRAKEAHRLAPDRGAAHTKFVAEHVERIVKRTGMTREAARRTVERQCGGVLLPAIELPFDAEDMRGCTVADVLADPDRFIGATLADPLEGPTYGRCKAKIMQRADGSLLIHSFAHGRTIFDLKLDAAAVEDVLKKAPANEVAATFVRLALDADLGVDELEHLRDLTSQRAGVGKRAIERKLKAARQERASQQAQERRERRAAERRDPRPQIIAPEPNAPWIPQMQAVNDVLGKSAAPEPPMRDTGGYVTEVRLRRALQMHTLTARGSNDGETDESRLPAPEHPLLTRLDDVQLSEVIERHIDYVDANGQSVHLGIPFVRHYLVRADAALPLVTAVATMPMVLLDGAILSGRGLNRERGIVFRVPGELHTLIPASKDCTPSAVAKAMHFLTDEWLRDVAADYGGKCVLIAAAATILERLLLDQRPAFFLTAGGRGTGKTTTANMISLAALGCRAAAAAWSPNEEERRKALLAYYIEGVPLICWDNIPRGAAISCPSIEKALTAETYSDRILGVSEFRSVPATSVHMFTGNNVAPRGDLASRSLHARLTVDRPDPENRHFEHPDALAWTERHRGRILQALYTILLGNPRLREANPAPAETRFKAWWHLVGSAIEHAAKQHTNHVATRALDAPSSSKPQGISFRTLLLAGEAEEEQTASLNTVLDVLRTEWPKGFKAADVAAYAGRAEEGPIEFKAALEQASGKAIKVVTPTVITWRLKAVADAPVTLDGKVVVLRFMPDASGHGGEYLVKEIGK